VQTSRWRVGATLIALLSAGCLQQRANPLPPAESSTPIPTRPPGSEASHRGRTGALLYAARGGDGDSWKDAAGREYRLGLVNAPETGECFGAVATRTRKELVATGFRAETYTIDRYGRRVSVVTLADGRNLNAFLARHGYADDRYLSTFRSENPALAAQLDPAFAAAKAERAGLWAACATLRPDS
jgi:endonuclease YncB( thermonuclease family)